MITRLFSLFGSHSQESRYSSDGLRLKATPLQESENLENEGESEQTQQNLRHSRVRGNPVINKPNLLLLVGFLIAIILLFSPYHALMPSTLVADDASYLSHGFTLGLDYNLQYQDMVANWRTMNGQIAAHPIGPGLMAAPFISLFSIIDRLIGAEVIHNHHAFQGSWSYFGFVFASSFYFIAGILLYIKTFGQNQLWHIHRYWLLLFSLSVGVVYYVLYRPIMGHSFEFFALSLTLYGAINLSKAYFSHSPFIKADAWWLLLGLVLTVLIRPANINVIALPMLAFFFVQSYYPEKGLSLQSAKLPLKHILIATITLATAFVALNYRLYDMAFPNAKALYPVQEIAIPQLNGLGDVFSFLGIMIGRLPQLRHILWSSEFGLLWSAPIILFGSFGYLLIVKQLKSIPIKCLSALTWVGYLGLPVVVILSWQNCGDAYGYRFLFCAFPVAMMGFSLIQRWSQSCSIQVVRRGAIALVALSVFSLIANGIYGVNDNLMFKGNNINAYGVAGGSAVGYHNEVAKTLVNPKDMGKWVAKRTPGFLGYAALSSDSLTKTLSEKFNLDMPVHLEKPSIGVLTQTIIILFMYLGLLLSLVCWKKKFTSN